MAKLSNSENESDNDNNSESSSSEVTTSDTETKNESLVRDQTKPNEPKSKITKEPLKNTSKLKLTKPVITSTPSTSNAKQHPATSEMVLSALNNLEKRRSGQSLISIKKYIQSTYLVDMDQYKRFVNKYLTKAVESGEILKIKGSFKLANKLKNGGKSKAKLDKKSNGDKNDKDKKPKSKLVREKQESLEISGDEVGKNIKPKSKVVKQKKELQKSNVDKINKKKKPESKVSKTKIKLGEFHENNTDKKKVIKKNPTLNVKRQSSVPPVKTGKELKKKLLKNKSMDSLNITREISAVEKTKTKKKGLNPKGG